jgi:hypothetical protein
MDLQLTIVTLLIATALAYLGRACWRSLRGSKRACGSGGCACAGPSASTQSTKNNGLIPSDQLTLRHRNGPAA